MTTATATSPRSGVMPRTDFRYEEFENLLASFYLTLLPLKDSSDAEDKVAFEKAVVLLNGFAERQKLRKPEEAAAAPRATSESWGQPEVFRSCWSLRDMLGSFLRDFGVGDQPGTVDQAEYRKFGRLILDLLHRHNVIVAEFHKIDGQWQPVRTSSSDHVRERLPLAEVLTSV